MFALAILLVMFAFSAARIADAPARPVFIKVYEPTEMHGRLCAVNCPWFPVWLLFGCTNLYCGEVTNPPDVSSYDSDSDKTDNDENVLIGCKVLKYNLVWGSMNAAHDRVHRIDSFHYEVEGVVVDRWDKLDPVARACVVETGDNQFYDTEVAAEQRAKSLFPIETVARGIYRGVRVPSIGEKVYQRISVHTA